MLKLTKVLDTILDQIRPDNILFKCHLYLIEFAADSNKLNHDDIGVKTVKTILNELVKLFHDKIWDYYQVV